MSGFNFLIFFSLNRQMYADFQIFIILTDELPVLRFIVNLLYRPVIQAPNWVALGLEIMEENFYYYS